MTATILVAERFTAPAQLHAIRLPRDAARRTVPCDVWVAQPDWTDWRCGRISAAADEGAPLTLVFPAFRTDHPGEMLLAVTEAAGEAPPPSPTQALHDIFAIPRPPIVIETATPEILLPPLPPRGLHLVQNGTIAPNGIEDAAATLPVTCDYANMWRDKFGAYLSGWTHCGQAQVTRVALVLGETETEMPLDPRADVLPHYPDVAPAMPVGWRGYIEGAPGHPLRLSVTANGLTRIITPDLPDRLTAKPKAAPLTPPPLDRFAEMVNQAGLSVLEIGSRIVAPGSINWRHRMHRASRYVGLDIHMADNVDIEGDAHRLTAFIAPASFDAIWSCATFEHLRQPWLAAAEINRALRPGGITFHWAPHTWPLHEAPADYSRFSDEGLKQLFGPSFGFEVIEAGMMEEMAIHPTRRDFPEYEMPLFPGYGHAFVLSRKIAELPPSTGLEAEARARLADSHNYPETDRADRERAEAEQRERLAKL